jgi:hypothetical protein
MLDPEGAIQAALLDVAQRDADQLAAALIDAAQRQAVPLTALLIWIYGRPRPLTFAPREFLQWAERSPALIAAALQTHAQFVTNSPGNPPTPPLSL